MATKEELKLQQQEHWETLAYRMDSEGFDYCFDSYSDWKEIKDSKFHKLREDYLTAMEKLKAYIDTKVQLDDEEDF